METITLSIQSGGTPEGIEMIDWVDQFTHSEYTTVRNGSTSAWEGTFVGEEVETNKRGDGTYANTRKFRQGSNVVYFQWNRGSVHGFGKARFVTEKTLWREEALEEVRAAYAALMTHDKDKASAEQTAEILAAGLPEKWVQYCTAATATAVLEELKDSTSGLVVALYAYKSQI